MMEPILTIANGLMVTTKNLELATIHYTPANILSTMIESKECLLQYWHPYYNIREEKP